MSAPLTPPDCDLRDFPRMMVDIPRLRGSEFDATLDDGAWRAGFNLWLSAWHHVPAGSLEDHEASLAKAAGLGRDVRTWRKVRDEALRGWRLCSDGLLYHPVIAEIALECWLSKLGQRLASGLGNAKRHGVSFDPAPLTADIRRAADMLAALNPKSEALTRPNVQKARAGLLPDVPVGPEALPPGRSVVAPGPHRFPHRSQGKGRKGNPSPQPPEGASIDLKEWTGSPDILDAIAEVMGRPWALARLQDCREQQIPYRALITTRAGTYTSLDQQVGALLARIKVRIVLEEAA